MGWIDAWHTLHPDDIGYTWFSYRKSGMVEKNQGLRLDYFLCNKTAAQMIKNCEIDQEPRLHPKPTDHCGLMLEIK